MEKLYTSKTFLKMDGERMHTLILFLGSVPGHKLHQKILAYFSHLAPLVLFFFTKRPSQKGGPWHNGPVPKYAPAYWQKSVFYFFESLIRRINNTMNIDNSNSPKNSANLA